MPYLICREAKTIKTEGIVMQWDLVCISPREGEKTWKRECERGRETERRRRRREGGVSVLLIKKMK